MCAGSGPRGRAVDEDALVDGAVTDQQAGIVDQSGKEGRFEEAKKTGHGGFSADFSSSVAHLNGVAPVSPPIPCQGGKICYYLPGIDVNIRIYFLIRPERRGAPCPPGPSLTNGEQR
jgi:hypothetical protein